MLPCRLNKKKHYIQNGFTLIEILVAVSIFSIIMVMILLGLRAMIQAQQGQNDAMDKLIALQVSYATLQGDIMQTINRPIRDSNGEQLAGFIGLGISSQGPEQTKEKTGVALFEFTRTNNGNPDYLQTRSHLQRVAYILRDNQLLRRRWPVLDRGWQTNPSDSVILTHIKHLRVFFVDEMGGYQDTWQRRDDQMPGLPQAIVLHMDFANWGQLEWRFNIPGGVHEPF